MGFCCYSTYNCALFFSTSVQKKYAAAHDGSAVPVHANDVFFGLHAVGVTLLTLAQMAFYRHPHNQPVSRPARLFVAALLATAAVTGVVSAAGGLSVLNWILCLSYLKLSISVTKYVPQAALNFRRKSTAGWSIENVLLDFSGGLLSVVQLVMDCLLKQDWSDVSGNPVKFGLGFTSMVFDVVFLTQHYVLYPGREGGAPGSGAGAGAGGGGGLLDAEAAEDARVLEEALLGGAKEEE